MNSSTAPLRWAPSSTRDSKQAGFPTGRTHGRVRKDLDRLCADLTAICEEHLQRMGTPSDLDRYSSRLWLWAAAMGLEHRTSTSLICSRDDLPRRAKPTSAMDTEPCLHCRPTSISTCGTSNESSRPASPHLICHRSHPPHAVGIRRIHLYYEPLALVRCGQIDRKSWLEPCRPGRHVQSVAESSFDAWTKLYQQDEDAPNAIVSYYSKGCMVALGWTSPSAWTVEHRSMR